MFIKGFSSLITGVILLGSCATEDKMIPVYVDQPSDQLSFVQSNASVLFDGLEFEPSEEIPTRGIAVYSTYSQREQSNKFPEPGLRIEAEGYVLHRRKNNPNLLYIIASDPTGAMYGILDVAEQLSFGIALNQIETKRVNPSQAHRVIKYNLPWSSYRQGEALSIHYETCRDTLYWESFLNMMVLNRFNKLSLWNMHPFTFMIKPEKYPEASPFSDSELAEWQQFWHKLFRMAGERGIETYIVNWNIFTSREFAEAHNLGEYMRSGNFWGDAENSELIEDYTRECVRQVINEYPNLTGLGLTLGERMGGMTSEDRRDWVDRTIIAGMNQANRKVKLLYRAPLSAGLSAHGTTSKTTESITRSYLDTLTVPEETVISFKYNWSHGHSSDKLFIVHGGKLTDTYWNPVPENYSVLWTVRNEDFFTTRWGQPDFIRGFLKNNMAEYTSGCIVGSECYIPAFDYFSKEMEGKPFTWAFERQWLWYSMWGRILYENDIPDKLFEEQLNRKFGIDFGEQLLETWKLASDYYHLFNSFYKGTWDATNYAEAFTSLNRGEGRSDFNTIVTMDLLGNRPVLDTTKFVNISDYVQSGGVIQSGMLGPPQLAEILKANAATINSNLDSFRSFGEISLALDMELADLELLAALQLFFAERIEATLLLAEHLLLDKKLKNEEIDAHLQQSIEYWKRIIDLKEKYNRETIPYMFNEKLNYSNYLDILEAEAKNYPGIEEFPTHDLK